MEYFLIGLTAALLILALAFYNAKTAIDWDRDTESHLTNTDYWYGPFYVNRNDKRFFLQKRRAGGYTINCGNPIGIAITIIFLGFLGWMLYLGS
jgi:uncharacterized membrane protein